MTNKKNETSKKGKNPVAILNEILKKAEIKKDDFNDDALSIYVEDEEVMLDVTYNKGSDTVDGEFWINEDEETPITEDLEAALLHKFNEFLRLDNNIGVFTSEDYRHFESLIHS